MITFLKAWKIWRGACPEVQRARILPEPGTDCAARFRLSSWRCVAVVRNFKLWSIRISPVLPMNDHGRDRRSQSRPWLLEHVA